MGNINHMESKLGLLALFSATLRTFSVSSRVYGKSAILTLSLLL